MIKFCIGHDSVLVDAAVYDLREKSQTSHSVKFNLIHSSMENYVIRTGCGEGKSSVC